MHLERHLAQWQPDCLATVLGAGKYLGWPVGRPEAAGRHYQPEKTGSFADPDSHSAHHRSTQPVQKYEVDGVGTTKTNRGVFDHELCVGHSRIVRPTAQRRDVAGRANLRHC